MSENKKLPATVKKDIQSSSRSIIIANVVLVGSITWWYYYGIVTAIEDNWVGAAFYIGMGTLLLWLFLPHIALNSIELYLNSARIDRDPARVDAIVSRTLRTLQALRMQKSLAMASILVRLGQTRLYQGFFDSAENLYKESIAITDNIRGAKNSINMAMYILNLASAYIWQGKYLEGEIEAEKALEMLQKIDTPLSKNYQALCTVMFGVAKYWLNDIESAEKHISSGLETLNTVKASYEMPLLNIQYARLSCCLYLVLVKLKQGETESSYEYYNKFFEIVDGNIAVLSTTHVRSLNSLASEFMEIGDYKHAEDLVCIAYELSSGNPFHPDSQTTLSTFERLLVSTERQPEVADMRSWLRPIPAIARLSLASD